MVHHECDKLPSYSSMHSVFERIDRSLALLHEAMYIIPDNTTEQMHISAQYLILNIIELYELFFPLL